MSELMQKVAEVAPEHYLFLEDTSNEIRQSPFRDEIVKEMGHIIKTAEAELDKLAFSLGGVAQGFGNAAKSMMGHPLPIMIGSTIAGGIALNLAGDLYEAARRGLTKSRNWSSMLDGNPDLATRAKSDPQVKVMFDTLHRFNPEFSADPHVAANFVKAQLEFPDDVSIPQNLVKSRSEIRNATSLRPIPGMPVKTPTDLKEQNLRMQGQQSQMDNQSAQLELARSKDQREEQSSADRQAYQEAQMENMKAQSFKSRQDAMSAYNQRMGMGSAEEMEQLRRRSKR